MVAISSALKQRIIPVEARRIEVRDVIVFCCPLPPPLNNLFGNGAGKGRVKSRRYRQWIKDAGWDVRSQRVGQIFGPVSIAVEITDKARGDTDGYLKSLVDLAVRNGIIEDDGPKFVVGLSISRAPITGARVTIRRAA